MQDEFDFIEQIKPKKIYQSSLIEGIGDDAALIHQKPEMEQIICMDTMVEGIHFTTATMSPYQIGYKALAVNISDIAAMGGIPTFYLVSIAIPKCWDEQELLSIYDGMAMLANKYKMDLIGGDTVSTADCLTITVTVIGEIEKDKHLLRSNAKPGDIVFVTGTVGDSAAGLDVLLHNEDKVFSETEKILVYKHQFPQPRVEIGRMLAALPRVSLNDISDGIASEANEIAKASQVVFSIDEDCLPLSKAIREYNNSRSIEWALYGGEDFELIGTMPKSDWENIYKQCDEKGFIITKIGTVSEGPQKVLLNKKDKSYILDKKGYNHFKVETK
ncbi:thiamine-phosphate kinase [Fredinandcohnia sp. SECRCQ15]|uniref:Thiamine-monophosphate kinase n=1 Tax=Fredinandcohnia quinoae TaxID=2918902 RepID=A0AAW5EC22_9BACI|nr:thiamine-phosphate kinase [Fredinandcohnia sp. SECRCQ15]